MDTKKQKVEQIDLSPPGHLSERAKALWSDLVPRRASSPGRLTLLTVALEALDRAAESRRIVDAAGLTFTTATTGAVHVHPLLRIELESRHQFATIWETLGFGREWHPSKVDALLAEMTEQAK